MEDYEVDLRDYIQVIWRHKWIIVATFLVAIGIASLISFTQDPVYRAQAKIILEESKLPGSEISQVLKRSLGLEGKGNLQNRLEILTSRPVLKEAIKNLENSDEQNPTSSNPGHFSSLSINDVRRRVSAKILPNTDIIQISATGGSAREAQAVTNALVKAYRDQEVESARADVSGIREFLKTQVKKLKTQLESAEKEALNFQQKTGLVLGKKGIEKKLTKLEEMKTKASVELGDKKDQLQTLNKLLDTVKEDLLKKQLSEENQPVITELQDKITQLKKLRKDIKEMEKKRTQYLDQGNYIKAQQMEDKIVALRKKYQESTTEQFEPLKLLPRYEELIKKQLDLKMEIEALQNRVEILDKKIKKETEKLVESGLELTRLQRNLDVNKKIYTLLRRNYEEIKITEASQLGETRVVSWAELPQSPIKPKKKLNITIAGVLGLFMGTLLCFFREYLDTSIKTSEDVESLDLTSLGTVFNIQHRKRGEEIKGIRDTLVTNFAPTSLIADSYTAVEANLRFVSIDDHLKSILITSSLPKEGKTTTAINLGLTMAQHGNKILLVESDLRKPTVSPIFGLDQENGLTNLALKEIDLNQALQRPYTEQGLAIGRRLGEILVEMEVLEEAELEEALQLQTEEEKPRKLGRILVAKGFVKEKDIEKALSKQREGLENFYIIPSGPLPPNPAAFLNSEGMRETIQKLENEFDLILYDSPPIAGAPDGAVLSTQIDGVLLIIEAGKTDREAVKQTLNQLEKSQATILGTVLNKARKPESRYYYKYGYYGYGYGTETKIKQK